MIMALFPQDLGEHPREAAGVLFRFESGTLGNSRYGSRVLIRSSLPPANLPGLETIKERREYQGSDTVVFRIVGSPVVRRGSREAPLIDDDARELWLCKRFAGALKGMTLVNVKSEVIRRNRSIIEVVQLVEFDGIAVVEDSDALNRLLKVGVGRNKSYGAGLLTIKKI
jgi:CRISPR system Cascade subunit CasE